MSINLKLVSCISAFILVLGIFIFGVLSAQQATVNLGGSIIVRRRTLLYLHSQLIRYFKILIVY
mgnify:FL=1